jgi:2-oxoglutarate ferredoxin oxidoreductase subunit beta
LFSPLTCRDLATSGRVLHVDPAPEDLHAHLDTVETPFNKLAESDLCPGVDALEKFNSAHG